MVEHRLDRNDRMCFENMMHFEKLQGQLCAQQDCSVCAGFGTSDRLGGAVLSPTASLPESVGLAVFRELTSQHVGGEHIAVSFPDRNLIGFSITASLSQIPNRK